MDLPLFLASIGAIFSMISNIPQAWKVRNFHTTDDIHSYSVVLHMLAALTWSMYGFTLQLYLLGVESFIVFLINTFIIAAIIRDRVIYPKTSV